MSTLFRKSVNLLERAVPRWLFLLVYGSYACVKNTHNLLVRYGLLKSSYLWRCTDRNGDPIPWFSYPAVEYLDSLDLSRLSVFEYGCGYSTLFWSRRASHVTAVEDSPEWKARIEPRLDQNARLILAESAAAYPSAIHASDAQFDIIVIDGSSRLECAKAALPKLRPGGVIILDDADDHQDVAATLRQAGLIEVDFAGFNAINTYTKTTSFFLHRDFRPKPQGSDFPRHSVCHPKRCANNRLQRRG